MAAKWFYRRSGAEHGPVSSRKIRRMVERGELAPTDTLWKDGMDEWRPAGESAKLFGRDEARASERRRRRRDLEDKPKWQPVDEIEAARTAPASSIGNRLIRTTIGDRPLLVSLGIGAAAGTLISALVVAVLLGFDWTEEEQDAAGPVAVVAPPAKAAPGPVAAPVPGAAKPESAATAGTEPVAPQPASADPAAAEPAGAVPAAVENVAVANVPNAPAQPRAAAQPEQPAESAEEMPAETTKKPLERIRVRLPGEDF